MNKNYEWLNKFFEDTERQAHELVAYFQHKRWTLEVIPGEVPSGE